MLLDESTPASHLECIDGDVSARASEREGLCAILCGIASGKDCVAFRSGCWLMTAATDTRTFTAAADDGSVVVVAAAINPLCLWPFFAQRAAHTPPRSPVPFPLGPWQKCRTRFAYACTVRHIAIYSTDRPVSLHSFLLTSETR